MAFIHLTKTHEISSSERFTSYAGHGLQITNKSSIRLDNVRCYHGLDIGRPVVSGDCMNVLGQTGLCENIRVFHSAFIWSIDELLGTIGPGIRSVLFRDCIISEALHDPQASGSPAYHEKGPHGMGVIAGGGHAAVIVFERCLWAHIPTRVPRTSGRWGDCTIAFLNNVVYNWGHPNLRHPSKPPYISACGYSGAEPHTVILMGNYYIPGPDTTHPEGIVAYHPPTVFYAAPSTRVFAHNNWYAGVGEAKVLMQEGAVTLSEPTGLPIRELRGLLDAHAAYERVIRKAGPRTRNATENRIVYEVATRTGFTKNVPPEEIG